MTKKEEPVHHTPPKDHHSATASSAASQDVTTLVVGDRVTLKPQPVPKAADPVPEAELEHVVTAISGDLVTTESTDGNRTVNVRHTADCKKVK